MLTFVKNNGKLETNDGIVDIMRVGDKVRWANIDGEQNSSNDVEIIGVKSDSPTKVVVRQEGGESIPFPSIRFARQEGPEVLLSGYGSVRKERGEIVRIRNQKL